MMMLRDLVKQAFDETLPGMGLKSRRPQFQFAMMVADKLELGASAMADFIQAEAKSPQNSDASSDGDAPLKGGGQTEHKGIRPEFGMIEAGTGTGKTLGYLIPALLRIAQSGGKARITTHTLALQDQIYGRDAVYADKQPDFQSGDRSDMAIALECVARILPEKKRLSSGFRKGRQAYVSPSSVLDLLDIEKAAGEHRHGNDALLAEALRNWALEVQALHNRQVALGKATGLPEDVKARAVLENDLKADELQGLIAAFMGAHEGKLPVGISASEIVMIHGVNDNPFHKYHGENSMDRDVLVVSHTLSLIDLLIGGNHVLPAAQVVVHDEADTLAGVGEMYARKKIRPDLLLHYLRKAYPERNGRPEPVVQLHKLLSEIVHWFSHEYGRRNPVDAEGVPLRERPVTEVMLADNDPVTVSALQYMRMINDAISGMKTPENASLDMKRFYGWVSRARDDLKIAENAFPANTISGIRQMKIDLDGNGLPVDGKTRRPNGHLALGLTWSQVKKSPAFEVVHLYAGRMFSGEWFFKGTELETILLTSATLRNPPAENGKTGQWDYMHRLLGTPEPDGLVVSVDNFGKVARIHVMRDIKNENGKSMLKPFLKMNRHGVLPYNPQWVSGVQKMLAEMLKTGERGLVLTSSFRDVNSIMEGFASDRVWWQTDSKSMHWKDGVKTLQSGAHRIMVTPSVWAGANIRAEDGGQLFRHLGVLRCPTAPGDMIRQGALANYFRWKGLKDDGDPDDVAKNVIRINALYAGKHKMTQGLGRGIRSAGDVIEVWLMDPRLMLPQWQATFPERFRGLFADPDVLRVVDTKPHEATLFDNPVSILNLLKTPQPKKKPKR
jgi:Rad3-related DNA helicase